MKTLMTIAVALLAFACGTPPKEAAKGPDCTAEIKKAIKDASERDSVKWEGRMTELLETIRKYKLDTGKHITGQAHVHTINPDPAPLGTNNRTQWVTGFLKLDEKTHKEIDLVPFMAPAGNKIVMGQHYSFDYAYVPIPSSPGYYPKPGNRHLRYAIIAVNLKPEGKEQHKPKP